MTTVVVEVILKMGERSDGCSGDKEEEVVLAQRKMAKYYCWIGAKETIGMFKKW